MKTLILIRLTTASAFLGLPIAVAVLSANANDLPPASTQNNVTYATDIKPIFDHSCIKCHSGDKPKAHLKLDSLTGALKGGEDGKVIVPGDSAKSMLILNVAHMSKDDHDWMPPLHNRANIGPLTPEQIGLLRTWIDQGAK
jgi:hypothetical protein